MLIEILWASCRELYNIFEADKLGCHIITVQNSMFRKKGFMEYFCKLC